MLYNRLPTFILDKDQNTVLCMDNWYHMLTRRSWSHPTQFKGKMSYGTVMTWWYCPMNDRRHKSATGVQASSHKVEMSRRVWRGCRNPDIGVWRMRRRCGHGWQWERSWNSNIRLKAPRRKNSWTASRSPHTEAPLLLLLHVLQVNPDFLLLCLHHLDTLPVFGIWDGVFLAGYGALGIWDGISGIFIIQIYSMDQFCWTKSLSSVKKKKQFQLSNMSCGQSWFGNLPKKGQQSK